MIRAGPPIILRFFGESSKNSTHSFRFKTAAFLLGDGRLNYGREMLWRPITWRMSGEGSTSAPGLQH